MVTRRLRALDRKLLRDVWQLRGQALAIASVMAAGIAMFVMYFSNFASLDATVRAFYARQRFADVFVTLTRAPETVAADLASVEGIEQVETRVVTDVTLDVPGLDDPAAGRLVSLPASGASALNQLVLRRGRSVDRTRDDEVLASEAFADANALQPGDRVAAVINGRRRWLILAGIALSPEYVYSIRPGELLPDARRYGVLWMSRDAVASATGLTGAFNDVLVRLADGASRPAVIDALDRRLASYGGHGAIDRARQVSAWTLANELDQLSTFGTITPAIFLGVATVVLHIAMARALTLQRSQIATLKALGYSNPRIRWHYLQWALLMAAAGVCAGLVVGWYMGGKMLALYLAYFALPTLTYHMPIGLVALAMALCVGVALLGAEQAVGRAVAVPPAVAMQPEAPARYRPSHIERGAFAHVPLVARMVLRVLERQPGRAVLSVTGMALSGAVLYVGFGFIDAMDLLVERQLVVSMRQEVTVTLRRPASWSLVHALARLPGVVRVEPQRDVPARLRVGHAVRTVVLRASVPEPVLQRLIDRQGRAADVPEDGVVLSAMLGRVLGAAPGDRVQVEVLDGARPNFELPVRALVDDSLGLQAIVSLDTLHRRLREGRVVTGAALAVDPAEARHLSVALKGLPTVAGVALRERILAGFRRTMAEHLNVVVLLNVAFAGLIAVGVVYNAARVSLSERARDLASLRVLGFTRLEVSRVLLGELACLTLASLPFGLLAGEGIGWVIARLFNNEVYRIRFAHSVPTTAATLLTVLVAAALSGLLVRRRLDQLDLVAVLKARE